MSAALLYQSKQRWQIWAAFGGAVLLHLGVIAIAESEPSPPTIVEVIDAVDGEIESEMPMEVPATPDVIEASTPPPISPDENIIPEEAATPPPISKRVTPSAPPITKATTPTTSASATMRSAKVFALSAPRPEYPYEARRLKATGSGVAILTVDSATDHVSSVTIRTSTGHPALDNATVSAFRRWRFKPGTVTRVQAPITFTLTGAAY